jgi:hypothetical protein
MNQPGAQSIRDVQPIPFSQPELNAAAAHHHPSKNCPMINRQRDGLSDRGAEASQALVSFIGTSALLARPDNNP